MRTTVDLPASLVAEAKARAAREGRTLSAVVEDAVRGSFARGAAATERGLVELPTFSGDGLLPGVELDDGKALRDLMDDVT